MEGLKLPPHSLHSIHGGKPLFPFPKPTFTLYPSYNFALSTGFVTRTKARNSQFSTRSSSASALPVTEELMEDRSKNVSVSGDSIRQRFLEFFRSRGHKILPSASLVPDDPTVLLTIAGMLQFKPIFLGKVPRQVPRATTAQRCIRTNDVENVGRTARHHTMFEMLGNFSFGDYFKKDAIKWAWELSTLEFGLPATQLWISIYKEDDEAFDIWHDEVGVPAERIKRMGEEDNFWTSGVTGPCGPCSEIYYDFHPERGHSNADLGDDTRFIEFYNLVFMQYNRKDDGSLEPLKQKNIDTGLGLERMARILQKVPNNYETDLIYPILEKAAELANITYPLADDHTKMNLKIIGDHMRAIVYLISDGVVPSNIGRGYVVRRLIRRAVRTGRLLGIKADGRDDHEGAFLTVIAERVIELSTNIDSDVKARAPRILEEVKREELRFVQTLERGEKLLDQMLADALSSTREFGTVPCLSGKDAFLLYDTYGFPVEITTEVAEERGVSTDLNGFDIEMENQRRQSQAAHSAVKLEVNDGAELTENVPDTEFLGYDTLSARAVVESLLVNGKSVIQVSEGSDVEVLLNRTPFYAESGGQIGDHGYLCVTDGGNIQRAVIEIKDVQKSLGNIFIHKGTIREGVLEVGREVEATVDAKLRQRAKVHHTATHLLQAALKKVIGQETSQAGSLVTFDRLRFDFNFHRPLLDSELEDIEGLINEWIGDAKSLQTKVMPLTDAKRAGAIAMFGEKYGEQVRVVEVPGVSMELCGGTHVSNTSEIRAFKIISEQGIASGIRRIEAVAGEAFIEYINARDSYMKHLCSTLKVKAEEVTTRVENLVEELRMARNEVSSLRSKAAVYKASIIASKAFTVGTSKKIRVLVECMDDTDADSLKSAAEYLLDTLQEPAAVILGSCPDKGKVSLVAAFTPGVVDMGIQAGNFIGPIAKLCGGGGGGKPNFAQAGGRKPENLSKALEKAREDLVSIISE
ncbi:tRNA-synt_2c domain-containing protein/DHHA1 domain-containing protein/tRNA_SAD domain-containing protein [Cephalotus follicularis]|uniref:Probable alanine--tRNA ligase, chloroplastic n=1 Tax=Cephalotus follicularis TaxID=3775 RepID=A0A1Q3CA84_CEPFO|nr:tRNA-synt_2c domain-containing protein/DHHA1 domain-containing protein/tRNA_SAD domain-containing protein [Cephalotus follicularis]